MLDLFGLVAVEQITGDKVPDWLTHLKTLHSIGLGAAFVGTAYWMGILYDRVADTLMQDFERHGRLWVALNSHKALSRTYQEGEDVFKEAQLRFALQMNSNLTEWADYLRVRIRLTRALATLFPSLTVIWLLMELDNRLSWAQGAWFAGGIYAIAFLLKLLGYTYQPPRTDDADGLNEYVCWHRRPGKKSKYELKLSWCDPLDSSFLSGLVALVLCYWLLYNNAQFGTLWWLPLTGAALTWLTAWVWWRISRTFFQYLMTSKGTSTRS